MVMSKFLLGRRRDLLSRADIEALEDAIVETRSVPARKALVRAGDVIDHSTYLTSGFISRHMDDRKGLRQVVAVHVPGDFVDLHAYPLKRLDHDVETLTPCELALVSHERINRILASRPNLSRLLWFSTLLDAAMHREWIFRLGRLSATGRVGHFFCELEARLRAVGMSRNDRFAFPLTQNDMGDICGMTPVHLNRVLRELREGGLLHWRSGRVEILDRAGLVRISDFDPAYLYLEETEPALPLARGHPMSFERN